MTPERAVRLLTAAALGLALCVPATYAVASAATTASVQTARVGAPESVATAPERAAVPSPTHTQGEDTGDRLGLTGDEGTDGPGWWLWLVVALGGGVAVALTVQRSHRGSAPSMLWHDEH